jgi:hypothetical protein
LKLWYYKYSGLCIASELPLPEWANFEVSVAEVVNVRFSLQSPTRSPQTDTFNSLLLKAQRCYFEVSEVAAFEVNQGNHITITPYPRAGIREIRLFLIAAAWVALCYQRDLLPLHASVVQVGESAIAFCGDSGAGKSSTAAWLLDQGHSLISDDLCVCQFAENTSPSVWPSGTRLKLWNETLHTLGWQEREMERDHFRAEKFYLSSQKFAGNRPLPLRAIYLLEWDELAISRLKGSQALRGFIENATYGRHFIDETQVAGHWKRCTQLISGVPVWKFSRPRDWGQMEKSLQMLQKHSI